MSTKLAITVIKSSASFEQGCWVQTRKSCHRHCQRLAAILFWKQIETQISSACRYEQQGRFTGRTEWADVHTATRIFDRLKKIDQILKTELLYIFSPRTGNWQTRLNLTFFQWSYHDHPWLDFRRLPGPVFDPPGGWERAHFPEQRLVIEPTIILPHAKLKKKLIFLLKFACNIHDLRPKK